MFINRMRFVIVVFLLGACTSSKSIEITEHNSVSVAEDSATGIFEFFKARYPDWQPFAWAKTTPRGDFSIVAVDSENHLKTVLIEKTGAVFSIEEVKDFYRPISLIEYSDTLPLKGYLPADEYPFKSELFKSNTCKVHFIYLVRALSRSFEELDIDTTLDLRIIVEDKSQVTSNELVKFEILFGIRRTFIADINGDGNPEYVFVGEDNSTVVMAWTIRPDCQIEAIKFKEATAEGVIEDPFLEERVIFLKRQKNGLAYDFHTIYYEHVVPKGEVLRDRVESIYKWNAREKVYEKVEEISRLKR